MKALEWIKKNKLVVFLILVVLFLLYQKSPGYRLSSSNYGGVASFQASPKIGLSLPVPQAEFVPSAATDRIVIEESSMSLVVSDVRGTSDKIVDHAKQVGGFMVSTSLAKPQEAPFATVVVRVPVERFKESLDYYRSLSVKVSSENILGTDVTDEYTDIDARLSTLEKTKAKFEEILAKAVNVQEILQVQREIISLQDQIDALKGRKLYLEKTSKLAKITVYLSTDELALPYAPTTAFRPALIYKLAVRSLIGTLRSTASLLIWVGVYAVIWVPLAGVAFLIYRLRKRRTT